MPTRSTKKPVLSAAPPPAKAAENARKRKIVAAAEHLFSRNPYEAVSIRDIATAAGVNSALVGYHFGTKDALYHALFERRYHLITAGRIAALEALRVKPESLAGLRAIVRIWTGPLLDLASDPGSRDFLALLAREASEAAGDPRGIFAGYLDPSAKACVAKLRQALPKAREADVVQGYLWMVAAVMSSITTSRRNERLQKRKGGDKVPSGTLADRLETFVASGFWALVADAK